MTFTDCCELIADVKGNYKVVYPSLFSRQNFSFKFESKGRQYDTFDVVYMHYNDVLNVLPPHQKDLSSRIKALGMSIETFGVLVAMSNGAWKKSMPNGMKEFYDERRREFERTTGIKVT